MKSWKKWAAGTALAAMLIAPAAAQQLYVFSSGSLNGFAKAALQAGAQGTMEGVPVSFYVYKHPKGIVMFDCGNNDKTIANAEAWWGPLAKGWVTLSPAWVEPLIAASVVWVALENLRLAGAESWRRHALAFGFGLVHGLGFAAALLELQLQGWPLARALLGFNLGVECGQALVVLVLAPLLAWAARRRSAAAWQRGLSAAIALVGLVWFVQRVAS